MRIQADSLTVTDDVSQKDRQDIESRMKQDVLETSRFSEIAFDSTKISASKSGDGRFTAAITGDLTLHGVTQSLTFNAQVVVSGTTVRGFGEFSVRQTDYDITTGIGGRRHAESEGRAENFLRYPGKAAKLNAAAGTR